MATDVVPGTDFEEFVADVASLVEAHADEHILAREVATRLETLLHGGFTLPDAYRTPRHDRYVMYPLHIDAHGRFSIAAAVWNVGHSTPVHSHETWGVVGIYEGVEGETRYEKPVESGVPLVIKETDLAWSPGQVTVCCTTDDDVHRVECIGDEPCVGIHVYGSDIGTLPRRSYDPSTGEVTWFTSSWETGTAHV